MLHVLQWIRVRWQSTPPLSPRRSVARSSTIVQGKRIPRTQARRRVLAGRWHPQVELPLAVRLPGNAWLSRTSQSGLLMQAGLGVRNQRYRFSCCDFRSAGKAKTPSRRIRTALKSRGEFLFEAHASHIDRRHSSAGQAPWLSPSQVAGSRISSIQDRS